MRKPIAASGRLSSPSGELVGGDLLDDEPVVGQVVVERADDLVAVGVRVRVAALLLEDVALGVGVAGDVEPVPAPALAVVRARRAAGRPAWSKASGDVSSTNASTSSGVGGRPVRSKVARRISVALVGRGGGSEPWPLPAWRG